jgi:V/A-type H+-transporting ATPase subunit I
MLRLAIWGVTSRKTEIIEKLHDFGVLHLEFPRSTEMTTPQLDQLRLLRGKLLGMLESLEWKEWSELTENDITTSREKIKLPFNEIMTEINESLDKFSERLTQTTEERNSLRELYLKLKRSQDILYHFHSFVKEEADQGNVASLWWVDKKEISEILTSLRTEIVRVTPVKDREYLRYHSYTPNENETLLAISVQDLAREIVTNSLRSYGAIHWKAPAGYERDVLLDSTEAITEGLRWIPLRLEELQANLKETARVWGPHFASLYILADERLEELLVEKSAHSFDSAFLIEGWLPADELEATLTNLKGTFGNEVFVQWRYPSTEEWNKVPISLSNKAFFRPYELFLKLLQPPRYKTADPTAMIALFFPFFGGCMVGDMGYGAIILLLGWWLYRKKEKRIISDLGYILISLSIWSIIWGLAYGEFFGDVAHRLFHLEPLWVERSHAVMPVMAFTIALGAAHIILGLLIGFYEGIKAKNKHIWMEKSGNLLVLIALISTLVSLKGWLPHSFFTISMSILIVGLVLLVVGGGIGGLVESFGAVGNILSYVRIAAIGLSSAILALVASKFVDVFGLSILGLFLALCIHLLNFVLAIGGASIHSARLHYVEFMGKFYSGGGKDYKPFSRRRELRWKKE